MIQESVAHLGIEYLSPAPASWMAKDLDDQVQAFLLRLIEQTIPYLYIAASYYKIRDRARYVTKAVLVVVKKATSAVFLGASWQMCQSIVLGRS